VRAQVDSDALDLSRRTLEHKAQLYERLGARREGSRWKR